MTRQDKIDAGAAAVYELYGTSYGTDFAEIVARTAVAVATVVVDTIEALESESTN